jgi:uncharacterized membrane protein
MRSQSTVEPEARRLAVGQAIAGPHSAKWSSSPSRRRAVLVATVIFLIAVVARMAVIDRQGLWGDEAFSLAMASGHSLEQPAIESDAARGDFIDRPAPMTAHELAQYARLAPNGVHPAAIVRATRLSDTSPPLYYLLLAYWMQAFGTSDLAVKLFSVICGLLAFPVLWKMAGDFGGSKARVPAALIYALAPVCIYYSTEVRMYALLWLLAGVNLWATLRLSREGNRWPLLAIWIASATAGLYTHYFFLFILAATGIWMLIYPARASRWVILAAGLAVAALSAPWYLFSADLSAWRLTQGWQTLPPSHHRPWLAVIRLPFHFLTVQGAWGAREIAGYGSLAMYAAMIVVVFRQGGRRGLFSPRRLLLWMVCAAACAGVFVTDQIQGTYAYTRERYVLAAMPAAYVLIAAGLARLSPRLRATLIILLLCGFAYGDRKIFRLEGRSHHPVREVAAAVRDRTDSGDLVLVHSIPSAAINLARYLESPNGSSRHVIDARSLPLIATWVDQLGVKTSPADVARLVAGRHKVVYVRYHDLANAMVERDWLDDHGELVDTFRIEHIPVRVYKPADGAPTF